MKQLAFPTIHLRIHKYFFEDEAEFRNLIVWLEDQKIRHYKIEDRQALRNTTASNWTDALQTVGLFATVSFGCHYVWITFCHFVYAVV